MNRRHIFLTDDMVEKMNRISEVDQRAASELIRAAVEQYIEKRIRTSSREVGIYISTGTWPE